MRKYMDNNPYGEQLSWFSTSDQHSYDLNSDQVDYQYPRNSQQGKVADIPSTPRSSYNAQREGSHALARMPKEQALAMVSNLKKLSLVTSIALFGVFSGIIATHLKVSASQATSLPPPPHESSQAFPSQSDDHSNSDSGGFFTHHNHRDDNFGNGGSFQQPDNGGSFQQPATGTHVSGR
jgi:hypothetical protein